MQRIIGFFPIRQRLRNVLRFSAVIGGLRRAVKMLLFIVALVIGSVAVALYVLAQIAGGNDG